MTSVESWLEMMILETETFTDGITFKVRTTETHIRLEAYTYTFSSLQGRVVKLGCCTAFLRSSTREEVREKLGRSLPEMMEALRVCLADVACLS